MPATKSKGVTLVPPIYSIVSYRSSRHVHDLNEMYHCGCYHMLCDIETLVVNDVFNVASLGWSSIKSYFLEKKILICVYQHKKKKKKILICTLWCRKWMQQPLKNLAVTNGTLGW